METHQNHKLGDVSAQNGIIFSPALPYPPACTLSRIPSITHVLLFLFCRTQRWRRRPGLRRIDRAPPPRLRLAHVSRSRWASASCASSEVVLLPRHPRPRPQPDLGPAARAALLLLPNLACAAASAWLHSCPCCPGCQCPCHRHRLGERERAER